MISNAIADYMTKRGIKQVFLCDKTGLSKASVSAALNGKRKLTVEEYARICEALSVPYNYFLTGPHDGRQSELEELEKPAPKTDGKSP